MTARPKLAPEAQLTVDEFLAFTDTRPEGERWELIEGVAVLNPSPVDHHQVVVTNIATRLMTEKITRALSWLPFVGTGTRVPASANSLPQPDVMVIAGEPTGSPVAEDALVVFEVLSKSNTRADQAWRRKVYASIPGCQHYVTVSLKSAALVAYDRNSGWAARERSGLAETLELAALDVSLALADVYRFTPIGA